MANKLAIDRMVAADAGGCASSGFASLSTAVCSAPRHLPRDPQQHKQLRRRWEHKGFSRRSPASSGDARAALSEKVALLIAVVHAIPPLIPLLALLGFGGIRI